MLWLYFFFYSLRYSFNTHPHPDVTPHCVLPRGVRSLCLQGSVGSSPQWLSPVQKWSVHTAGYTESRPDPEYDGAHPVRCRDFPPRQLQLWVQDQEWLSYKASQFPTQQRNQHHCRWVTAALTVTLLRHCPFQLHIMFCAICCGVNLKTQEHFRCLLCLFFYHKSLCKRISMNRLAKYFLHSQSAQRHLGGRHLDKENWPWRCTEC